MRIAKGISQKQIAEEVNAKTGSNINQRSYSGYERGFCEPHILVLFALATYHDLTMDLLCFATINNKEDLQILKDTEKFIHLTPYNS